MGSVRHLLSDLTLPLISVFSGAGFDRVVRDSMALGAQRIEDLWLRCFLRLLQFPCIRALCVLPADIGALCSILVWVYMGCSSAQTVFP